MGMQMLDRGANAVRACCYSLQPAGLAPPGDLLSLLVQRKKAKKHLESITPSDAFGTQADGEHERRTLVRTSRSTRALRGPGASSHWGTECRTGRAAPAKNCAAKTRSAFKKKNATGAAQPRPSAAAPVIRLAGTPAERVERDVATSVLRSCSSSASLAIAPLGVMDSGVSLLTFFAPAKKVSRHAGATSRRAAPSGNKPPSRERHEAPRASGTTPQKG